MGCRFNGDNTPFDKKSRLNSQLKFFGCKSKRFISVYAKKPRILVKPKSSRADIIRFSAGERELEAMQREVMQREVMHAQLEIQAAQLQTQAGQWHYYKNL